MDDNPGVSRSDGKPSAEPKPDAAKNTHQAPIKSEDPCESSSDKDMQPLGVVWLAELGKPQTAWIYSTMDNADNSLDVRESVVGVGRHLNWWFTERELALYDSPYSHYSDWLEICPILKGRAKLTNINGLKGKGQDHTCPLGVAPGSMLRKLMAAEEASKKQE